jgi:CspA family cold shock protein
MTTGKIKTLVRDRGFGFIEPSDGGADLFFHSTSMEPGEFDSLVTDQPMEFDVEPDPRNPQRKRAVNLRVKA